MVRKRLDAKPKQKSKKKARLSLSATWSSIKSSMYFKPVMILFGLVIGVTAIGLIASFLLDDVFTVVPGYYENKKYNQLTAEKNDLIDENAILLSEKDVIEDEIAALGSSSADFKKMEELNAEAIEKLEEISANLERILELDEEFARMRLPQVVTQYVSLSQDLDETRAELVTVSLEMSEARLILAEFNGERASFDECLAAINWSGDDKSIAEGIAKCNQKIDTMKEISGRMKEDYDVELAELDKYLTVLGEQWAASVAYYNALAARDYTTANSHDAVFVEKKREISELDSVSAFNEFSATVLTPLVEEFEEVSALEVEREEIAGEWYDSNVRW